MVSSLATWLRLKPFSNSQPNVAATGMGSEMPVDSITRWSNRFCFASARTVSMRSSPSVQQAPRKPESTVTGNRSVCENAMPNDNHCQ